MRLLALETSTLTTSAALLDGERVVVERDALATPHSEALLPLIDEVLAAAGLTTRDLDALACGVGPGSFTGLRIGLATAKGLAYALGRPLVAVSSLAALAQEGVATARARTPAAPVLVVTDARRGELYAALYRVDEALAPAAVFEEQVITPEALVELVRARLGGERVVVVGDGVAVAGAMLATLGDVPAGARVTPSAAAVGRIALARLGHGAVDELGTATPAYLRLTAAEEKFPPR